MNATSENPILSWQEEETNWQVGAKKSGRTTAVTQDKEKRERERGKADRLLYSSVLADCCGIVQMCQNAEG